VIGDAHSNMAEQPTEAEPETTGIATDERPSNERWRPTVPGTVRVLVGAIGLAGIVLGAKIAWRSQSGTTLLIVSAVLLVLAALGLDWNAIRATWRGITVELARVQQQLEQTKSVASVAAEENPESPALREVVESLGSLSEQVKALTPRPRSAAVTATSPITSFTPASRATGTGASAEWLAELFRTKATHTFHGLDSVTLTLRAPAREGETYACTVTTPSEDTYTKGIRASALMASASLGAAPHSVIYPDEFPDAPPFLPGRYQVEWRLKPSEPSASTLASALAPPVATDSFNIPERP
jgi:hypothetical protein